MATERPMRECIELNVRNIADTHTPKLRLLEVRFDPCPFLHETDDLYPGADKLPRMHLKTSNPSIFRSFDLRVAEVNFGNDQRCLFGYDLRLQCAVFGVESRSLLQ